MLPNKDKLQMFRTDLEAEALTRAAMRRALDEAVVAEVCECQGRNPADGPCQKCTEESQLKDSCECEMCMGEDTNTVHGQLVVDSRPRVLILGGGVNPEIHRALNAVFKVKTLVRAPAITREQAEERQKVAERAAWNAAVERKKWTGK